jgi:hypothetical protein
MTLAGTTHPCLILDFIQDHTYDQDAFLDPCLENHPRIYKGDTGDPLAAAQLGNRIFSAQSG